MSNTSSPSITDAIAAARAGRRDDAARLLRQIVNENPFNADAWVWLGGVTSDPYEQRSALEQAVAIAPENQRAQQGLAWLRQNRPDVFTTSSSFDSPTTTERATPSYEQPAVSSSAGGYEGATRPMPAVYETANPPAQRPMPAVYETANPPAPQPHEAPTLAMPVTARTYEVPPANIPSQTDRMATLNSATPAYPAPDMGGTDRFATIPQPSAPTTDVVEQRSPGANVARWLVLLLYLLGFGAAATISALTIADPVGFQQVVDGQLAPLGYQLDRQSLDVTRMSVMGIFGAIAALDFLLIIGFLMRGRWAWGLNLFIAVLTTLGAIALAVLVFAAPNLITGSATLNNPLLQTGVGGLAAFTLLFLLLSVASRRSFFPRKVTQSYGG